jgi:hypothetical protein
MVTVTQEGGARHSIVIEWLTDDGVRIRLECFASNFVIPLILAQNHKKITANILQMFSELQCSVTNIWDGHAVFQVNFWCPIFCGLSCRDYWGTLDDTPVSHGFSILYQHLLGEERTFGVRGRNKRKRRAQPLTYKFNVDLVNSGELRENRQLKCEKRPVQPCCHAPKCTLPVNGGSAESVRYGSAIDQSLMRRIPTGIIRYEYTCNVSPNSSSY